MRVILILLLVYNVISGTDGNHKYLVNQWNGTNLQEYVVCSKEMSYQSWFFSKWEYFKCAADESCCGNAWNRYCCIKNNASDNNGFLTDDPDIWAIIITFGIITISISLLFFGLYIAKRNRSVHYVKLTDFWQSYVVKTPVIQSQLEQGSIATARPNKKVGCYLQDDVEIVPEPSVYQPPMAAPPRMQYRNYI